LHGAIFVYPLPMEPMPDSRGVEQLSTEELVARLRDDQLWLLRQIDAGRWPEWRLDLAALERELDELLGQLGDAQTS
jgi:hypothetical protein